MKSKKLFQVTGFGNTDFELNSTIVPVQSSEMPLNVS